MNVTNEFGFQYPFGEESCEHELEVLQDKYPDYFYEESRFNSEALDPEVYLIVGRRGSGKTSLTKYFNFQERFKNAHSIDVDEPEIYQSILQKIGNSAYLSPDLAVNDVKKIWESLIWSIIFNFYADRDPAINNGAIALGKKGKSLHMLRDVLSGLLNKYVDVNGKVIGELTDLMTSAAFTKAKAKVVEFTINEPMLIAIDTFERYDRENVAMMTVTASLIQCANSFNISFANKGIHVKAFVSAEIFPHIKERAITNTTKFIRHPLYLRWRPKDLIRLISWRFYRYMLVNKIKLPFKKVNWDNFDDILQKMWYPFFGEKITNLRGREEKSFPYILRHTQMRPRQLVILCNAIARETQRSGKFPQFQSIQINKAIMQCEYDLADEVLNSYDLIYPRVSDIAMALTNAPMVFKGNYLDQVAKKTSDVWAEGYSLSSFRRLVAELGIVGKVRKKSEEAGIIEADFEYAMQDRLVITNEDECVIHPMFYSKLQVVKNGYVVYPFPDHEDYENLLAK
jgi:energy-coupling factor transporter ATP-binding protein EcfA2